MKTYQVILVVERSNGYKLTFNVKFWRPFPGYFGGNPSQGYNVTFDVKFWRPFQSKITGAGTDLIEGGNRRKCVLVIFSLKRSGQW